MLGQKWNFLKCNLRGSCWKCNVCFIGHVLESVQPCTLNIKFPVYNVKENLHSFSVFRIFFYQPQILLLEHLSLFSNLDIYTAGLQSSSGRTSGIPVSFIQDTNQEIQLLAECFLLRVNHTNIKWTGREIRGGWTWSSMWSWSCMNSPWSCLYNCYQCTRKAYDGICLWFSSQKSESTPFSPWVIAVLYIVGI